MSLTLEPPGLPEVTVSCFCGAAYSRLASFCVIFFSSTMASSFKNQTPKMESGSQSWQQGLLLAEPSCYCLLFSSKDVFVGLLGQKAESLDLSGRQANE